MNKLMTLAISVAISGCSTTPDYDARFGDAVRGARVAMTINANGGANPDQVSGLDGQASREAMTRYLQTFKEPPPVVNVINIGTGGSTK
jgi:hypothetical protein